MTACAASAVDRAGARAYLKIMAIREILTVPDPRLKEVSKPVEGGVTDEIRALMDDMLETMYDAPGIGLAAIQIGVPLRVIVMDLAKEGEEPAAALFREPGNRRDRGRDPRPMKRAASRCRTFLMRSSVR
jgi:hypothetical protein